MTEQQVLLQLQQLPANLRQEAVDFIGYLFTKYTMQKSQKNRPKFGSAKGKYRMSAGFN